jgi:hypothetical protein
VTQGYRHSGGKVLHRIRAEKALGHPLPKGAEVHHTDLTRSETSPLVICQNHAYHYLLHLRTKIFIHGGNPNTDAWCSGCQKPKPRTDFYERKTTSYNHKAGVSTSACKQCNIDYSKKYRKSQMVLSVGAALGQRGDKP